MRNALLITLLLSTALSLGACGAEIVENGERGVKVTFGKANDQVLPEGIYFYNPISSDIITLDTKVQRADGDTVTYTKDVQQAQIRFTLNYNLMPAQVSNVYKANGKEWEQVIVSPAIQGALKGEIGQWDAAQLVANREKATVEIEQAISERLKPRGVNVTKFELTDVSFRPDFEKAVEDKVTAIQRAEQSKNETVTIEEQSRQTVIKAKAEAESIAIRTQALEKSPALIQYEAVQKWNGVLPTVMSGESMSMFVDTRKKAAAQ